MQVRDKLSTVFTLDRRVKSLRDQIASIRAQETSIGGTLSEVAVQTSPRRDPVGEMIARRIDLEDELIRIATRLLCVKAQVLQLVEALSDERQKLIMTERYINLKRWEDIAADNHYSWKHVHRLHSTALTAIKDDIV